MEIDVLGAVRVRRAGVDVDLGTPRQRAIIAALALSEGRVLPVDALVGRVWGEDPPATVQGTLQSYVGHLRRALEPDRAPREAATVLVTEHDGYALRIPRAGRDDAALADATGRARELLRVVPDPLRPRASAGDAASCHEAVALLDVALARWRGAPYADLGDDPDAVAERTRLDDLRSAALEQRVVARLAVGHHDEVVPELEAMTRSHPLHERWWTLYAVALARTGRQADALAALQRLRSVLDDELGVEPSLPVRQLQTAILRQDVTVSWHVGDDRPAPDAALDHPVPAPPRDRVEPPALPWPLVGRGAELERLVAQTGRAAAGVAQVSWIGGEAGIGKSRLVQELALAAYSSGFTVLVGSCGHFGAPDLWPWRQVFTSLAQQAGPVHPSVEPYFAVGAADGFATWDALAESLRAAARDRPLLVVVEDVHDADRPTVQLLQHLVATVQGEQLHLVATRRAGAGDDELLTPVAAAIARRGGARLDLTGLDDDDAGRLVAGATGAVPSAIEAAEMCRRTGGNPFFLVEVALAGGEVSGSVTDVVGGRLADLSAETREVLEAAAVVDLEFDEDLVAYMIGREPAEVGVLLGPALVAGLVTELDAPARLYRFDHAVVRDVVRAGLASAERARLHAEVATVLDERSGLRRVDQRAMLAQHWLEAGSPYVAQAWPSLLRAAEQASLDASYVEAAGLLEIALRMERRDYEHRSDRVRYEVLMLLVDARRWAGDWAGVGSAVDEAVEVAERMGEADLAARAAMSTVEGALWQVRTFGVVHAPIVAALERAIVRLDAEGDRPGLRARARLALANELYYSLDFERVDRLVTEALGLAEEAGDARLLSLVLPSAFSARWRPDTLDWRRAVAARAVAVANEVGDGRAHAVALGLQACAALEAGDATVLHASMGPALALSERLGLVTVESVLHGAQVPWLLLVGDLDAARASMTRLEELAETSRVPNLDRAALGTAVLVDLWAGDAEGAGAGLMRLAEMPDEGIQMAHLGSWVLLRLGQPELAAAVFPAAGIDLTVGTYVSLANACLACEIGLGLDDTALAVAGYAAAAPYAGRMTSGGSAMAIGPVDGFLALGAVAAGDRAAAVRHADDAARLASEWGLAAYADWLAAARTAHGI